VEDFADPAPVGEPFHMHTTICEDDARAAGAS
jgi:hypothetical protein